jgi:hypothetical protein
MANEVQAEACSLPLGSDLRVGQPDRRHQIASRELGQDPGIDAVGLARERRESLHLGGVRDLHLEAVQLELIVDEAGTAHRLDRRPQRLPMPTKADGQAAKTVRVGGCSPHLDGLASLVEQVKSETLATEIQASVQHANGPPLGSSWWTSRSLPPGRPFFIAFLARECSTVPIRATKSRFCGDFVPRNKPSDGLEPSTPSL